MHCSFVTLRFYLCPVVLNRTSLQQNSESFGRINGRKMFRCKNSCLRFLYLMSWMSELHGFGNLWLSNKSKILKVQWLVFLLFSGSNYMKNPQEIYPNLYFATQIVTYKNWLCCNLTSPVSGVQTMQRLPWPTTYVNVYFFFQIIVFN